MSDETAEMLLTVALSGDSFLPFVPSVSNGTNSTNGSAGSNSSGAGDAFDGRALIIGGLVSQQNEPYGWNAIVRPRITVCHQDLS